MNDPHVVLTFFILTSICTCLFACMVLYRFLHAYLVILTCLLVTELSFYIGIHVWFYAVRLCLLLDLCASVCVS